VQILRNVEPRNDSSGKEKSRGESLCMITQ
jgi:hypothetical protein